MTVRILPPQPRAPPPKNTHKIKYIKKTTPFVFKSIELRVQRPMYKIFIVIRKMCTTFGQEILNL